MDDKIPDVTGRYLLPQDVCVNEENYMMYRCDWGERMRNQQVKDMINECLQNNKCDFTKNDTKKLETFMDSVNIFPGSLYVANLSGRNDGNGKIFGQEIKEKFANVMSKYKIEPEEEKKKESVKSKQKSMKQKSIIESKKQQASEQQKTEQQKDVSNKSVKTSNSKKSKSSSTKMSKKSKSKYFKPQHGCRLKHPTCRGHIIGKRQLNLSKVLRMGIKRVNKYLSCNSMRL